VFGLANNSGGSGVYGENDGTGYGTSGRAITGTGVFGEGLTGVRGNSLGAADGVDGTANNSCCSAVYGQNSGTGNGVAGRADSGTGVLAASTGGIALKVTGKATFSTSGVAVVPTGSTHVKVTMAGATTSSMILATVQQAGGFYVKYALPASGSFTIFLNKAPTSPTTVKVAYFVLN
jgi:hypothetical protein